MFQVSGGGTKALFGVWHSAYHLIPLALPCGSSVDVVARGSIRGGGGGLLGWQLACKER